MTSKTPDVAVQAQSLTSQVGVRALPDRRVLRLRGDDQRSWLNGQVTADVRNTQAGDGVYALVVNVKGRILADVWVLDDGSDLLLLVPDAAFTIVRESFEHQIIMEDVELEEAAQLRVLSAQGPLASALLEGEPSRFSCDELGSGGFVLLVTEDEQASTLERLIATASARGGGAVDEPGFELARIRAGRPRFGPDFGQRAYPQEAGLKGLAVSFNKGCYLGQEVVCTLENRGRLTRRLMRLEATRGEGQAGDELRTADGKVVGQLTSVARDPELGAQIALGYVKLAHGSPGAELNGEGDATWIVRALAGLD